MVIGVLSPSSPPSLELLQNNQVRCGWGVEIRCGLTGVWIEVWKLELQSLALMQNNRCGRARVCATKKHEEEEHSAEQQGGSRVAEW